jgi:protein-L-isoaspartate(D-aspartate) O-methyltransferase
VTSSERVAAAMAAVPRLGFLPADQRPWVERDAPLPIGAGQTNSQPTTVRIMLEQLDVCPGDRVLDVGSGSGWTTALLAHLAGPAGDVLGVELVPELVDAGRRHLEEARRTTEGLAPARIEPARPGVLGAPEAGPFARILVSAEPTRLPDDLVGQLAPGGVMVIPVGGRMCRVVADPDGSGRADVERTGWYRFVPLLEPPGGDARRLRPWRRRGRGPGRG